MRGCSLHFNGNITEITIDSTKYFACAEKGFVTYCLNCLNEAVLIEEKN